MFHLLIFLMLMVPAFSFSDDESASSDAHSTVDQRLYSKKYILKSEDDFSKGTYLFAEVVFEPPTTLKLSEYCFYDEKTNQPLAEKLILPKKGSSCRITFDSVELPTHLLVVKLSKNRKFHYFVENFHPTDSQVLLQLKKFTSFEDPTVHLKRLSKNAEIYLEKCCKSDSVAKEVVENVLKIHDHLKTLITVWENYEQSYAKEEYLPLSDAKAFFHMALFDYLGKIGMSTHLQKQLGL